MIISHRHKFIFLHCRKVAGSSITALLNQFLGPDDLQLGAWEESLRFGGRYNRKAIRDLALEPKAQLHLLSHMGKVLSRRRRPNLRGAINVALKQQYCNVLSNNPAHATAELVRDFAPDAWRDYYKFCFVRNPFEHAVSDFFWRKCPAKGVDFVEFLKRKQDRAREDPERVVPSPATNWPIYTIQGKIAVDFVGRYETLSHDLERVFSEIGLDPQQMRLQRAKGETRKKRFAEMYNSEARALVEDVYGLEISEFGYGFSDL